MASANRLTDTPPEDAAWGIQLIVDCFGVDYDVCCDLNRGYEFLDQICQHLKMTKQTQPYIFKTCETTFPGRPGYSGWVPIIESGIQVHTSAYKNFISVDVYSCKDFDDTDVVDFVKNFFRPERVQTATLMRGTGYLRHRISEPEPEPAGTVG
ncbi:MAG: S-adenosylmethionine decarboxylase [Acidobacteriota bacterium]